MNLQPTVLTPRSIAGRFSPRELVGQFVLSRHAPNLPWRNESLHGWHLAVEDKLPCSRVAVDGEVAGWLLGHAIGPDGRLVTGDVVLRGDGLEQDIYAHGGRFLVALPLLRRLYLDPCGLLSAVCCRQLQLVASSTSLVPYDVSTPDRAEFLASIGIPFRNAMFPAGMTPRAGVERLLPNHYLDLDTFETHRHWPVTPLAPLVDAQTATAEIAELTKRHIRATIEDGPTMLSLTAGKDSRMLLACARDCVADLSCTTVDLNDEYSRDDCRIARKLAAVAGVPHRVLKWAKPEERDLDLWLFRTGFGTGEVRGFMGSTTYRRHFDARQAEIVGSVGEVARGFYWQPDDMPDSDIPAERLLRHCNCLETPETLERMHAWKTNAVVADSLQLLDLFYIEQRMGCWAGVWSCCQSAHLRYQAFPLSHRRLIELMMRLPVEMRRSGALPEAIIAREWPELLEFPFNELSLISRLSLRVKPWLRQARRAAANPGWAASRALRLLRRQE